MTRFGKTLVYLNLFAAVALFAWATSLYANQPLWFDRDLGGDAGKVEGQLTQLGAEVKRLTEAAKGAQLAYARAAATATTQEYTRDVRKTVLDRWMLEVSDPNNNNALFRQIPRIQGGSLINVSVQQLQPQNGLTGQPLRGLGVMKREMSTLINEEKATVAEIKNVRQKILDTTSEIDRIQIEVFAQKDIRRNLKNQESYLADKQIDWDEQLRTLNLRKSQLESRMKALTSGGAGK